MEELLALKAEHESFITLYEGLITSQKVIIDAQQAAPDFYTDREDRLGYLKEVLEGFERCLADTQVELAQVNQQIAELQSELNPVAHSCLEVGKTLDGFFDFCHQALMKIVDPLFSVFDFFDAISLFEHMMILWIFIFLQSVFKKHSSQ